MKNQFLLLEDVDGVGNSGDIVSVRAGFARNFLLPQKKAVIAEKHLVRLQEQLRQERAKRAVVDRKEAEQMSQLLSQITLKVQVRIDAEGHMYGSVTAQQVAELIQGAGFDVEKKRVLLHKPIKTLGEHQVALRLKEGVAAQVLLQVQGQVEEG